MSKLEKDFYTMQPTNFEIVPWVLFDTEIYHSNFTTDLGFFNKPRDYRCLSNIYLPSMLPNPQAFLLESIRIYGIVSNIRFGVCTLQIGSKTYAMQPAWTYALKEKGYILRPKLLIMQQQFFRFDIHWDKQEEYGNGFTGKPIEKHPIQIAFYGQLARPLQ